MMGQIWHIGKEFAFFTMISLGILGLTVLGVGLETLIIFLNNKLFFQVMGGLGLFWIGRRILFGR